MRRACAGEDLQGQGKQRRGRGRRRHEAFYLSLAERAEPELRGQRQVSWLNRLERENDDIRAAMSWALPAGHFDTAARLGWALRDFWWLHGHHREARRWMRAALEHEPSPALRARALHVVHNYYAPDPSLRERAVAEARAGLGAKAFEEAWGRGRAMSFDGAVEYALGVDTERPF